METQDSILTPEQNEQVVGTVSDDSNANDTMTEDAPETEITDTAIAGNLDNGVKTAEPEAKTDTTIADPEISNQPEAVKAPEIPEVDKADENPMAETPAPEKEIETPAAEQETEMPTAAQETEHPAGEQQDENPAAEQETEIPEAVPQA